MPNDATGLKMAIKEALKSTCKERHAAVVLVKGKPVSIGHNSYKNNPEMYKNGYCSTHAEMSALAKIKFYDYGYVDVLVIRLSKKGKLLMSRPCDRCIQLMKNNYKVRRVFFSDSDGTIQMEYIKDDTEGKKKPAYNSWNDPKQTRH